MWTLDWLALILKNMYIREDSSCKGGMCGWERGPEGGRRSSQVSQACVGLSTARRVQCTHEGQIPKHCVYRSQKHS